VNINRFCSLKALTLATLLEVACLAPAISAAGETKSALTYNNGAFEPATLTVAANEPVKLTVTNTSDAAIEFESFELNRERVVLPGKTIVVLLPKLEPGEYHFFDDFHRDRSQGTITVR